MNHLTQLKTLLILLALVPSCHRKESFQETKSQSIQNLIVGEGFDLWSNQGKNQSCLDMTDAQPEVLAPKLGQLTYQMNSDFDDVIRDLGGWGKLSLNFGAFGLDAEVNFANHFRHSHLTSSIELVQKFAEGRTALPSQWPRRLNGTGENFAQEYDPDAFQATCGTHFVRGRSLHGSMFVSLILEFNNLADKLAFDAKINVELAGIGSAEAEVEVIVEEFAEKASIKLVALQTGGDPVRLTHALSHEMASCSAKNRAPCYRAFDQVRHYASEDLPNQFKTDGKIDPSRFATSEIFLESYAGIDPRLEESEITPGTIKQLRALRERLLTLYSEDEAHHTRAQSLLKSGAFPNEATRIRLQSVSDRLEERLTIFRQALQVGLEAKSVQRLRQVVHQAIEKAKRWNYDPSLLQLPSQSFADYCLNLKKWHGVAHQPELGVSDLILAPEARRTFVAMLNSPKLRAALEGRFVTLEKSAPSDRFIAPDDEDFNCGSLGRAASGITHLTLTDQKIADTHPITTLTSLSSLDLTRNRARFSLANLSHLGFLRKLTLRGNKIQEILGLPTDRLERLDLADNRLSTSDLSLLRGGLHLRAVDLSDNRLVSSLDQLPPLPHLEELKISYTSIEREAWDDFVNRLKEFPLLRRIEVSGSLCQQVHPRLQIDCR